MARNALLVRFAVFLDGVELKDVISFNGLSMGGEGVIDIPEWDRTALISNGKRKVSEIVFKYRLMETSSTHETMTAWWGNRSLQNKTVNCTWYNRAWEFLLTWSFLSCELAELKAEDQELGTPKLGIFECKCYPYDVEMLKTGSNKTT